MYRTSNDSIPPFTAEALASGFELADHVSGGSNCVRRQVGAVLLDPHGLVKSVGFNTIATVMKDCSLVCPRASKSYDEVPTRASYSEAGQECYSTHAEMMALKVQSGRSVQGWWILVTNRPCNDLCQPLLDSVGVVAIWRE